MIFYFYYKIKLVLLDLKYDIHSQISKLPIQMESIANLNQRKKSHRNLNTIFTFIQINFTQ
jgi:hypothetical protein